MLEKAKNVNIKLVRRQPIGKKSLRACVNVGSKVGVFVLVVGASALLALLLSARPKKN